MTSYDTRVFLPAELLTAVGEHTGHFWPSPLIEPFICDAIRAWMKPVPAAQRLPTAASEAGYQWKQVFLPEGTKLRASFDRRPYFAVVEGAQIKFGELSLSPSHFANLHGSGNRNAWKAIWLRLPGSEEWLRADLCRSARNRAIARMFEGDPPAAHTSEPCQTEVLLPSEPEAGPGVDVKRKHGSGHAARRKRRAKKHRAAAP